MMLAAGLTPTPILPTPRAVHPAIVQFARALADDASERTTVDGQAPLRATASRDGWFVLTLEWAIEAGALERWNAGSAAALADKALER